jgi:beta-N-acetylhexosaminidase
MTRLFDQMLLLALLFSWLIAPLALPVPQATASDTDRVEILLAQMTTRQKVGQLFMVTLFSPRLLESNRQFIADYYPGAIALFGSNLDYQSSAETTALINSIQTASIASSGVPMFVAADQEGGLVWRLINGFTHFPKPLYLGAMQPDMAYRVGQAMGREMAAVGVNMNLAPVIDLTTREDALNKYRVLFARTMGENPHLVGINAGYLSQGMATSGVVGVLKHFPGHSPTHTDSHIGVAQIDLSEEVFRATNLRAYALAIENGAQAIMVGHLYYPALEPVPNRPATLSPLMINLLREELGFDGVIMTDAFDMGAIQATYDVTEAAVVSINAGVDMVVMGPHMAFSKQKQMIERMVLAVETGEISQERLDASVRRILSLKAHHHLLDWTELEASTAPDRIQAERTSEILVEAFANALTILKADASVWPLRPKQKIGFIHLALYREFGRECLRYFPDASFLDINYNPLGWEYSAAVQLTKEVDVVVVVVEDLNINSGQLAVINLLPPAKTIVITMSTPYDFEELTTPPAGFMVAYDNLPEAQRGVCQVLAGERPAQGQLAVRLTGISGETAMPSPGIDSAVVNTVDTPVSKTEKAGVWFSPAE